MPQGIPDHIGQKFSAMLEYHDNVVLIHARNKVDKKSRYLIFRVNQIPGDMTSMELLAELLDGERGRVIADQVEPHPEADIEWNPPTDIPPAFR